ncbi:dephospho-CoA kinase [Streptococcus gallolyticus]|nr:dephospho-CoA kinase [Streptococcus gallolyticus]MBY5040064.1 dephospho-CoA kinase [Streptococcus gallolyticus]
MSKIIGITGGIASGKSTVTKYLRQLGYEVIDADQVVHDLQAKEGKLYEALIGWLGESILDGDGNLNRPALAQLIFSSQENLNKSARLQSEIIRKELARQKDQLAQTQDLIFMDIPLLIEADYVSWFDEIWLVAVDEEIQLQRLKERNGYTDDEAQKRLDSQMSLAQKRPFAQVIFDNSGSLAETFAQIDQALKRIS